MIEFIKNISFLQIKKVLSVTVNNLPEGILYDYVILEKNKSQISIIDSGYQIREINDILSKITNKIALVLSIQGKGILTKSIQVQDEGSNEHIINKLLPNADIKDFYLSKTSTGEQQIVASIIRQNIADEIIALFPNKNIVGLSIGANQIVHLFDVLSEIKEWNYNNFQWRKEGEQINYIKLEQTDISEWIRLGNERLHTDNTVSYAQGLSFLIALEESFVDLNVHKEHKQELLLAQVFTLSGWAILIVIFSVLLINFLLFDHYNKKLDSLSREVEQNSLVLSQMENLKEQIKFKENFVKNNSTGNTRFSYYADIIAGLLPQNIVLISLDMQSLKKRIKKGHEANFEKNRIIIKGYTKNSRTLNDWIKALQQEDWIEDTEIIEYNREASNMSGEFELGIDVKHKK